MKPKRKRNNVNLPQTVLAFYIKLYCERKDSTETKYQSNLIEATKSWVSLSDAEKQCFQTKYKEYIHKYKLKFFHKLKHAEPFMKEKEKEVSKNINSTENSLQDRDHEDSIENFMPEIETELSEQYEISNELARSHDAAIQQLPMSEEIQEPTENESTDVEIHSEAPPQTILMEPLPPAVKTGNELYKMLNSTDDNTTWASLPQLEKIRYSRAVTIMKKDYISKYKEYLVNLSPKELFDYYNKIIF